jgi:hypothetical protein
MRLCGAFLMLVAFALAGCHSPEEEQAAPLPVRGPAHTLRVALDPAFADRTVARALAGPFRLVRRSRDRVVVARPGLKVVFLRLDPYAAVRAFRDGELDEAPVPQGEIRALEADAILGPAVRARSLFGVDVVVFERRVPTELRRAYWLTVPRGEYQALISERVAPAAFGLLAGAAETSPAEARRARASVGGLPRFPVRLGVPNRPELVEAAEIPWAEWRQLGLQVKLVVGRAPSEARFLRLIPAAPHAKALFAALGLKPAGALEKVDARLRDEALVVPLARVAEARLVSPRVRRWEMDALGIVDYSRVRLARGA